MPWHAATWRGNEFSASVPIRRVSGGVLPGVMCVYLCVCVCVFAGRAGTRSMVIVVEAGSEQAGALSAGGDAVAALLTDVDGVMEPRAPGAMGLRS